MLATSSLNAYAPPGSHGAGDPTTAPPFGITKAALHPDGDADPGMGWKPFNDKTWGSTYLGACDTTFLSAYAVGLFITGPLGDRLNLRWFLGIGMILSGAFCFLFGSAVLFHMHALEWFLACNALAGLVQATGWPSNVTLMTRWFGQGNRGTIMGIWNAQASVGNIIGKFWGVFFMHKFGWGYAFMATGGLCAVIGLLELAFVVPHPHDVLSPPELAELDRMNRQGRITKAAILSDEDDGGSRASSPTSSELDSEAMRISSSSVPVASEPPAPKHHDDYENISFMSALRVPGVIEYSACLFFSKLVAYAFTFWLPFFLSNLNYSDNASGNLSTVYDMGGVAGGIIAGWASDRIGKSGLVSAAMLLMCLPGLWVYSFFAGYGIALNVSLMFVVGILVNGPYTLISGVVAADLGNHPSLKGNPKAMSTVTGIIDGSGSIGAALQSVVIGLVSNKLGWSAVFYLLEGFCFLAAVCLFRILSKELGPMRTWRCCRRADSASLLQDDEVDVPSGTTAASSSAPPLASSPDQDASLQIDDEDEDDSPRQRTVDLHRKHARRSDHARDAEDETGSDLEQRLIDSRK